jgi:hypothetical protein
MKISYEDYGQGVYGGHVVCEAMLELMFWRNTLPPNSGQNMKAYVPLKSLSPYSPHVFTNQKTNMDILGEVRTSKLMDNVAKVTWNYRPMR